MVDTVLGQPAFLCRTEGIEPQTGVLADCVVENGVTDDARGDEQIIDTVTTVVGNQRINHMERGIIATGIEGTHIPVFPCVVQLLLRLSTYIDGVTVQVCCINNQM